MGREGYQPTHQEEKLATEMERDALKEMYKKEQDERIAGVMEQRGVSGNLETTYPENKYGQGWVVKQIKGTLDGKNIELNIQVPPAGIQGGGYSGSIEGKPLSSKAAQNLFGEINLSGLAHDFSEKAFEGFAKDKEEGRQRGFEDEQRKQGDALAGALLEKIRIKYTYEDEVDEQES